MPLFSEAGPTPSSRSNTWGFAFVFVIVNLHVLRNVAAAPYLAVYALVSLWALNRAIVQINRRRDLSLGMPAIWVITAAIGFLSAVAISGMTAATYGLVRYLFAIPVFFAFVAYTESRHDLLSHIRTMCAFFALGALTVPLQYVTGPITFFAAASERAGLERFASLFGSLTALGIAAGSYIALSQALRPRATILGTLAISIGGVASLSKAAIANIALGLAAQLAVGGRQVLRLVVTLAITVAGGYFLVQQSPLLQESLAASATSFGVEGGSQNFDMSFQSSLYDRLVTRPAENWAVLATLNSSLVYLLGGGFGMASTALVPANASLAPMTHNQFAEFYSVFGLIGGTLATLVVATIGVRLVRNWRIGQDPMSGSILAAFALWVANSFFANGTAYQPVTASVLFLAMYVAALRPDSQDRSPAHDSPQKRNRLRER